MARLEVARSWRGPMPDPQTLREYEEILPGAANRIIKMAEANTSERASVDRQLVRAEIDSGRTGQWMAFGLSLFAFIASIVFFALGKNVAGGVMLSPPVIMLVKSMIQRSGPA